MSYHLRTVGVIALLAGASYAFWREPLNRCAGWMRQRPKIIGTAVLLVALVPMIWTTRNIVHYAVNVPRQDDWEMARLILKQHAGQLTWRDLFAQQEEARTVLPKLIFLLSAATGEWDVRQQIAISLVAAWVTTAGICFLLWKTRLSLLSTAISVWIAALCIFSPAQVEAWLLASGFPSFLPALFIVAGLVVMRARSRATTQFAICAAAAMASTFTLPHGLLAWPLTFPVLQRRWSKWLAAWIALSAACAVFYFWGYAKPQYLPELAPHVSSLDYLQFFLIFLGGGFAYASTAYPAFVATCTGAVQFALLLVTLAFLARRVLREDAVVWLALAAYTVGSAILATIGRVGYGPDYALASRYVPFSIYLTIADAALIAIVCRELPTRRAGLVASAILCTGFVGLYARASATTVYFMRHDSASARLARGALLFSRLVDSTQILGKIYPPDATLPARLAAQLDDAKLLQPPLVRSPVLDDLPRTQSKVEGEIERQFAGWSALLSKNRPADCVLLAYENSANQSVPFEIADTLEPRYDIVRRFRASDLLWSGWSAKPRSDAVPAAAKISAWAVDADDATASRLEREGSR